jgi:phosphoserine aminotransferase
MRGHSELKRRSDNTTRPSEDHPTTLMRPTIKPANPNFSSGPCAKRPGYDVRHLSTEMLGRSHRSALGKATLARACSESARLLGLPAGYRIGIVPASDTGAIEMAMWSLLGPLGVDVLAWESFSATWVNDIVHQLKLPDTRVISADYGDLPDLTTVNFNNDVVFVWNGTTSGVKVPNGDWIPDDRNGLTLCDATSAVFAMEMPWEKLDVVTYSWQKVLGGEGAHGMLIMSPRAIERLEHFSPSWPMPKIFRMTQNGQVLEGLFRGETINTPSMLCVADYLDALRWVDSLGGLQGTIRRSEANLRVIADFVAVNPWLTFLANDPSTRSNTSVCLRVDRTVAQVKAMVQLLEDADVAYDLGSYKEAPAGLRIWCGATVEASDLLALMPWLKWAYQTVEAQSS